MKPHVFRANIKKQKYLSTKPNTNYESDDDLSSDDEETISIDMVGIIFNSQYIIIKYLGRGTFSKVWLVYDMTNNDYKVAKMHIKDDFEECENELNILTKLQHNSGDNVIKFYDSFFFEKQSIQYRVIIFELLGISLMTIINDIYNKKVILTNKLIKHIYTQILSGIANIHSNNIIHCDIKPDNILTTILPTTIKTLIEFLNTFNLTGILCDFIEAFTPDDFLEYNKVKRKNIKKKIRHKSYRALKDFILEKIKLLKYNTLATIENKSEESIELDNYEDIKYDLTQLLDTKFVLKIIDFGNSELQDNISESELYIRSYRPIENIININYNYKADIWVLGCIFYEILTGQILFTIENCKNRNMEHLSQIKLLFGNFNKSVIDECDFYEDYFCNGKLKKKNNLSLEQSENKNFEMVLKDNILINDIQNKYTGFLKLFFEYNPNLRLNANSLIVCLNKV